LVNHLANLLLYLFKLMGRMFTEECKTHNPNTYKNVICFMPNAIDLTYATEMHLNFFLFLSIVGVFFDLETRKQERDESYIRYPSLA
jgi:hypothetical protein